jgi:hypothetical protein
MLNNLDFLKKFDNLTEEKIPFLKSSFEDNVWEFELNKQKKQNTVIDFNIHLKDGKLLTAHQNYTTLYTFKKCIDSLLLSNDMHLNAESTIITRLNGILHLFNLINFYDDGGFSKNGFKALDRNQLLAIINKRLKNPKPFDLYSGKEQLEKFLAKSGLSLSSSPGVEEIKKFKNELKSKGINLQKELFPDLFLGVQFSLEDVFLDETINIKYIRECSSYFRNDDTSSESVDSVLKNTLYGLNLLKNLHLKVEDKSLNLPFKSELDFILSYDFKGKKIKHFETYPVSSIFKTMKNALDFHFNYGNEITETFCLFLDELEKQGKNSSSLKLVTDKNSIDKFVLSVASNKLKKIGLNCYYLDTKNENYFNKVRKNQSLISLLKVYYGSVLFVVGALMARRQSEIKSMEIDCFDEIHQQISFRKSKSYIHSFGIRDYISLPTTEVVIEMLKNINKIAKKLKTNEGSKIFAFPKISQPWNCSDDKHNYYENLDNLMDYFEVDLIGGKRPYIRQHQLRRFFAMAFFWSKGFKSIDTLRWFLGHTNPEHVYHYIQENLDGHVLNNVKAQYITENINNYSNLKEIMKNKFGIENYSIIDKNDLSDYINTLLEDKLITVEPEFLEDDKNNQFEIIVKVKNHG